MSPSSTRGLRRTVTRLRRGFLRSDGFALLALVALALAAGWATNKYPEWAPPSLLALVVLIGGFILSVRGLWLLLAVVAGVLAYEIHELGWEMVRPGTLIVVGGTAAVVLAVARSRARLGVQGCAGSPCSSTCGTG